MERKRTKLIKDTNPLPLWATVVAVVLLSQNLLILPVISAAAATVEDQKNYYFPPTDPNAGTPPSGSSSHNPPHSSGGGGGHGSTPTPSHGTPSHGGGGEGSYGTPPANCGTPPSHGGGGGGSYHAPPTTPSTPTPTTPFTPTPTTPSTPTPIVNPPVIVSPPSTPIDPGTPTIPGITVPPGPPYGFDPNSPPFSCTYWRNHPTLIWGLLGWWGTVGGTLGATSIPGFGSNMSILDALSNSRTDGFGALYREGTASFLNSMAHRNFPYTTQQVRDRFAGALSSNKAAGHQARLFKQANEGKVKA